MTKQSGIRARAAKVLFVDLDEQTRAQCARRFMELGYETFNARHVAAGVTRIAVLDPTVIVAPSSATADDLEALERASDLVGAHLVTVPSDNPLAVIDLMITAMAKFGT